MNYCGLDLAGVSSYAYVSDSKGKRIWSGFVKTTKAALEELVQKFLRGGLKVAIEAGNQTAWIHEVLVKQKAKVTVVHPKKVKLIAESRSKTDKIDAKILCELLRLEALPHPVHMPGPETRALRGLLVGRRQLIAARTKLCNVARGMLRQEGIRLPARALSTQVGWRRLLEKGFEQEHLLHLVTAYYESFLTLTKSIRELDRQLAAREQQSSQATRLKTMPRVGRIASLTFLAAVDDVRRFSSSRKVVSYSGLAPTVRQSGERAEYGSITREGRKELRAVWVQIAHAVATDRSRESQPLRNWFLRVAKRRGKKTALVGLARRLLVIAYQLLRTKTDYDASRLRRRRAA